jgi:CMP-N-acetylneuraminic acid synthetase
MNNVICIIPARRNSIRLKNKNIKLIHGKPLIAYTIECALSTKLFDKVYVATNDNKIANISKQYGATVPFLLPEEICKENVASSTACLYLFDNLDKETKFKYDSLICLQPTSPLKSKEDIMNSLAKYNNKKFAFLVSTTFIDPHYFHWAMIENKNGETKTYNMYFGKKYMKERIYLPDVYRPNGAIKIANIEQLKKNNNFFGENTGIYHMPDERSIHIATQYDFDLVCYLIKK